MSIFKAMKENVSPLIFISAGILLFGFSSAFPQGMGTIGENTDLWRVRGSAQYPLPPSVGGAWRADSLWLGATFQRDTTKRFIVWLAKYFKTQASYKGTLYIMAPRPGRLDTAIFLFKNRCNFPRDSLVDLTDSTPTIRHLDTVYFMYRSDSGTTGSTDCGGWPQTNDLGVKQSDSLFTGPNRGPGEGWTEIDRHYSLRDETALRTIIGGNPPVPDTFFSLNKQKWVKYGRRWCAAGWIHRDTIPRLPGSGIRTDTVEFGFEDQYKGADIDYDDIRFNITGVFINYPIMIDSLALRILPNVDTIAAGDSITFRTIVYGRDSLLVPFIDSTNMAKSVLWRLAKSTSSASYMRIPGTSNTNTFKAVSAYEIDTIVATYLRFEKRKAVYVKPGPDYKVWIEPDSAIDPRGTSAAMIARLQAQDSVASVTITSLENEKSVYGVVRDQFGNFTRFANNSVWIEVKNAGVTISIANPVNGTPAFIGLINRVNAGSTNVQVSAKNLASGANPVPSMVKVIVDAIPLNNLINDQTFSMVERSVPGTLAGNIAIAVPSSANVILTQLTSVPEFAVDLTTRNITVAAGAVLNYKTKSSFSFKLVAKATNAFDDTATITIQLIELTPIANLLNDQVFSVKERSPAGTAVGTVVKAVPDSILVTLTPIGIPAEFAFNSATRIITVAPGAVLNYDTKSSYSFRFAAEATNAYALNDTATITIQLVADSLIPAIATLLDTNHNGHIDMIHISWTDSSAMKTVLPSVAQLIRTLSLTTLDNQNDSLHATALVADFDNNTIHIVISENSQTLETGWDTARISLTTIPVSVKGGYFLVNRTIDSVAPIVTAACNVPGGTQDSLVVTFSEPLDQSGSISYLQMLIVNTKTGQKTLSSLGATMSGTISNKLYFLVPAGNISPYENSIYLSFAIEPPSPSVEIDYCHPLPIIVTAKAGPNPFTPNIDVPPGRRDNDPLHGIRIEILLNSANTTIAGGENRPASCTIFDAVGNVILKDVVLKPDPAVARKKYFIWDGKNKNGMSVAGGTYLARVIVEDKKNGSKVVTPIKIGVRSVR